MRGLHTAQTPIPRKILHLDLDAFFCAVEEQRDPTLRDKPFAGGGRPDPAETLARNLQAAINNELSLPCSPGVATNKLVAKIANNVGKASAKTGKPPNTIKVIGPGQETAFLAPLPVRDILQNLAVCRRKTSKVSDRAFINKVILII